MRSLPCLVFIFLLACAGGKTDQKNITVDSADVLFNDTTEALIDHQRSTSHDSSVYIGPVYPLAITQEYYTPLYFINDSIQNSYDDLLQALDSVIYEETDEKRSRLKSDVAQKSFDLTGLDTISIFDNQGVKLYRARLERVEYLDTSIEGEFIAVYKPIGKIHFRTDVSYCISKGHHALKEVHYSLQEQNNDELSKKLIETFQIKTNEIESIKHFVLSTKPTTYSIITIRDGSRMFETGDTSREVIKATENILILNLIAVHFTLNDHPVLLAEMGLAESDAFWISLLTYSNGEYKANTGSRIEF